jgi:hypothetical protein
MVPKSCPAWGHLALKPGLTHSEAIYSPYFPFLIKEKFSLVDFIFVGMKMEEW